MAEPNMRKIEALADRLQQSAITPLHERAQPLFLREVWEEINAPVTRQELSLKAKTRVPDLQRLELLVTGMLLEREAYACGAIDTLSLLRRITFGGRSEKDSFAVDGIRGILPDTTHIRSLILSNGRIAAPLAYVLDLARVTAFCRALGLRITPDEGSKRKGIIIAGQTPPFELAVDSITVSLRHSMFDAEPERFQESLTRFIEFVELLSYKNEWIRGSMTVHLSDYVPLYRVMAPDIFGSTMSERLAVLWEARTTGLDSSAIVHETRKSSVERQNGKRAPCARTFALSKGYVPMHTKFITIKEDDGCLAVGFAHTLDITAIKKHLTERGFAVEEHVAMTSLRRFVNKGNLFDFRSPVVRRNEVRLTDNAGRTVLSIGEQSVFIRPQSKAELRTAGTVLDIIYNGMMFITPLMRDREHGDSTLSEIERELIAAMDSLVRMYMFFLEPVDGAVMRRAVERSEPIIYKSPAQRVMEYFAEGGGDAVARLLHTMKAMEARVNMENITAVIGSEPETIERAHLLYGRLVQLIEQFGRLAGQI